MITPEYCQTMAAYNRWQNNSLRGHIQALSEEALYAERGAFFGSIFKTANHLLWGDLLWISRFDGGPDSGVEAKDHATLTATKADWDLLRFKTDGRIVEWALGLNAVDLVGNQTWYSGVKQAEMSVSTSLCITHFFNHQTHHRGQLHAMLTAAGRETMDTDLVFMPEN